MRRALSELWEGLTQPSRTALLGALLVTTSAWAAAAALVGPEAVKSGAMVVAQDDDFAQVAAVSLRLADAGPGQPWIVLLGTSATREAMVDATSVGQATTQTGSPPLRAASLLAAAMTPIEMLALAEAVPAGLRGVAVVEISERNLAVSFAEHHDVIRSPRLPLDVGAPTALGEQHRLPEPRVSVGNYFFDHAEFFLARPQALRALLGRAPVGYNWHQVDGMIAPSEADWRRLVLRMRGWLTASEETYQANEQIYRAIVSTLRERGLSVAFLRSPRNPAFLERLDADPELAAARAALDARLERLATECGVPVWYVGREVGVQPNEFKDYTHLFAPGARQRFTARLGQRASEHLVASR